MVNGENSEQLKHFFDNLLYLRTINNLSKQEMAKILKIGVGSLNKIEKGILPKRLSVRVVYSVSEYFNIPPSYLFEKTYLFEKR